jgi:hypothetical protein
VQASIRSRFIAKLLQFVSEMQNTALEIKDHRVISRAMQRSFANLIFEGFLPSFKISNMVWFRHESSKPNAGDCKKERALSGTRGKDCCSGRRCLTHCPKASALLHIEETEAPHATSFSNARRKKNKESLTGL